MAFVACSGTNFTFTFTHRQCNSPEERNPRHGAAAAAAAAGNLFKLQVRWQR